VRRGTFARWVPSPLSLSTRASRVEANTSRFRSSSRKRLLKLAVTVLPGRGGNEAVVILASARERCVALAMNSGPLSQREAGWSMQGDEALEFTYDISTRHRSVNLMLRHERENSSMTVRTSNDLRSGSVHQKVDRHGGRARVCVGGVLTSPRRVRLCALTGTFNPSARHSRWRG